MEKQEIKFKKPEFYQIEGNEVDYHTFLTALNSGNYKIIENETIYNLIFNNKKIVETKIIELEKWFKWYDEQTIQYNRSQRLGEEFNKNISQLDLEAKINSKELKKLYILVNEL